MRFNRSLNTFFLFIAVMVVLMTAYYVEDVAEQNNVASKYEVDLSLTGSRLSDQIYASVKKTSERKYIDNYTSHFTFTIYNIAEYQLENWRISIDVPEGTTVENSYGVEFSNYENDRTLFFSPENNNTVIDSKTPVEFEVVLKTKQSYDPGSMYFMGYRYDSKGNLLAKRLILLLIALWCVTLVGFLVSKFNLRNYEEKQKNDMKIIMQSMNTFISFIDAKDPYTRGHSKRVAMYAAEISRRMGLSEDEIQNIYYSGLLHDAGKISIPDDVLNKPGKLSEEERNQIKNHTIAGGKMLKQMTSIRGIRETALYHHERYDGNGYPEGLKGEAIPLYARIVGVADSYDAMSSNRVYRRHLNKDEIIEEIQKGSGTQFDPSIVKYMVDMINDGYVNVVKMETADNDDSSDFHITENDIPGVNLGY